MCGRMTLTRSAEEIARFFELAAERAALTSPDGRPLRPRFNIAPSQPVLTVLRNADGARGAAWKSWGLVPAWSRDPAIGSRLFNARAETVDVKPSFRAAFRKRRCLVAADGFYEWSARNRGHHPHWFHPRDEGLLAFAGLYESWAFEQGPSIESCTVITTEANADLAGIHARMPVLLARPSWESWLDPASDSAQLKALLLPAADGTLAARAVSRHVNDPRHDDPECLTPVAANSEPAPAAGVAPARQGELGLFDGGD
jgi:putative SOS response-associated peptidase YedK